MSIVQKVVHTLSEESLRQKFLDLNVGRVGDEPLSANGKPMRGYTYIGGDAVVNRDGKTIMITVYSERGSNQVVGLTPEQFDALRKVRV